VLPGLGPPVVSPIIVSKWGVPVQVPQMTSSWFAMCVPQWSPLWCSEGLSEGFVREGCV
jgi:hypothetical protein